MTGAEVVWPRKTREFQNHHFDSTIWNDLEFRDDDIIVATYAKSGTTWTQQIIGQLVFGGDPDVPIAEMSPWVDLRVPPKEVKLPMLAAQTHRRIMKTHLPVDALVFSPKAKYVYIGRDGRDVLWSLYNHHATANDLWYAAMNDTPGRVGPPIERPDIDIRRYYRTWLSEDGHPFWPFWENLASWWAVKDLPNVKLIHFNDLKADLPAEMAELAAFLDIDVPPDRWTAILEHCSFDYMKANADRVSPLGGAIFAGGGASFINKGLNGRWRGVLSEAESTAYKEMAKEKLGRECAAWLNHGWRRA
jgi:aryl sulfotransferase